MLPEDTPGAGTSETPADEIVTDPPPAGDAPVSDQPGDDDEGHVKISKQEYLVLKDARQREKEARADLDRERAARTTPPTPAAATTESDEATRREYDTYIANLRVLAKSDPDLNGAANPTAKAILLMHDRTEAVTKRASEAENRQRIREEMTDVPTARRQEVFDYMQATGVVSPAVAYQLIRGGKEYETLAEKATRLEKELEAERAGRGVAPQRTPTRVVGGPALRGKGPEVLTVEQYNQRMRDDPDKTIADRRSGAFTIKIPGQ